MRFTRTPRVAQVFAAGPRHACLVTLRDELLEAIRSWDLEVDVDLLGDTPLITSGVFDSLALFNLVAWIEKQCGGPIDPATFDVVHEWNTIADVVAFVERRRGA
jgi:acyl carrier protein